MPEEALLTRDGSLKTSTAELCLPREIAFVDTREPTYLTSRAKRALDIAGALSLLALVLPLLVLVAALIMSTSRGGPIFRQRRYGRNKTTFLIYKLRSMRAAEDAPFRQAVRRDARVTWIGRIIRKTSIDELPQLFNVLKGEMSLVGPRPHPVELDDQSAPGIVGYDTRFRASPGITGLAQISGSRGATPTIAHMRRRIDFDLRYVREANLALDCKILARTVKELLFALSDKNAF